MDLGSLGFGLLGLGLGLWAWASSLLLCLFLIFEKTRRKNFRCEGKWPLPSSIKASFTWFSSLILFLWAFRCFFFLFLIFAYYSLSPNIKIFQIIAMLMLYVMCLFIWFRVHNLFHKSPLVFFWVYALVPFHS